jgi:glycosyltransferase involved in cell wall biosynthesis
METTSKKRAKIAWLSPLLPQKSGIANYSYWLVNALRPNVDIDLYFDGQEAIAELKNKFEIYPLSAFPHHFEEYDEVIYHLGNNSTFHKEIYKLAWNFPATVVLHDYNLSAFMHEAFYLQTDWHLYERALPNRNGQSDQKGLQGFLHSFSRNVGGFPMSHAVVNRSKRVIVHHRWVKDQFTKTDHIEVIPTYAKLNCEPTPEQIESFKRRLQIDDRHFLISCLGFVNRNKLPELQIEVVKKLLAEGYPVRLLFAGETAPDLQHLQAEVEASELNQSVTFTGFLSEVDYFSAIFAADIIINLRNPSMGEASFTLMQTLAAGKPAIISDNNQYQEFPDSVCWKVIHDKNEAELLYEYVRALLSNRHLRETMAANSLDYVEAVFALEKVIPQWLRVISK